MNSLDELIVVAGPTASGKTSYAIKLAKEIDAVLINADSMQVYKGMDIGTNKGKIKRLKDLGIKIQNSEFKIQERIKDCQKKLDYLIAGYELEQSGVIGYMVDVVSPDEDFTLAHYQFLVEKLLEELKRKGQKAILVGGTGLYIDSIINNYKLDEVEVDKELREELKELSNEQLFDELYQKDQQSALLLNQSDKENPRRLIRKIELAYSKIKTSKANKIMKHKMYYPIFNREDLYEKINNRVEEMFNEGLVDEVENLVKLGYKDCKTMQGMGYKKAVEYLDNKISLDEAKTKIKQAHRNYAARQITWFKNEARGYNLKMVHFK